MVPFWGRCTTHFRTNFSGDWDVHWGYNLDFDPWPPWLLQVKDQQGSEVQFKPLGAARCWDAELDVKGRGQDAQSGIGS